MKKTILLLLLIASASISKATDPLAGAKNLGWLSIMTGKGGDPEAFALYELWGFDKPGNEEALIASAAKAAGITDVHSGKVWSKRGYYDLQEKLLKEFPKSSRTGRQRWTGSIITAAADPNSVAQSFQYFLSNDYRSGTIPVSIARTATPKPLGSIIVACGPKDQTMTSFKVYEWWGTGLPRTSKERYLNMSSSLEKYVSAAGDNPCKLNDTVTGLTGAAAKEAFYRRIKGIRKYVSASVVNMRITTDDECKVVDVSPTGGGTVAGGGSTRGGSGTTADGIQYSSADMSEFTNNSNLGAMILYYGSGGVPGNAYIYELRGKSLNDKNGIASLLAQKISGTGFIGFEHRPGSTCTMAEGYIRGKSGSSVRSSCMGTYKVD